MYGEDISLRGILVEDGDKRWRAICGCGCVAQVWACTSDAYIYSMRMRRLGFMRRRSVMIIISTVMHTYLTPSSKCKSASAHNDQVMQVYSSSVHAYIHLFLYSQCRPRISTAAAIKFCPKTLHTAYYTYNPVNISLHPEAVVGVASVGAAKLYRLATPAISVSSRILLVTSGALAMVGTSAGKHDGKC